MGKLKFRVSGQEKSKQFGYSLIEILMVVAIFSVVTLIAAQSLSHSLRGSRKTDAESRVRTDVDFAMSTIERLLRNASSVSCVENGRMLVYTDEFNNANARLACCPFGSSNGYIASGSATTNSCGALRRITSQEVSVNCQLQDQFVCPATIQGVPPSVIISISAKDATSTGAEGSQVTFQSKILLRTY